MITAVSCYRQQWSCVSLCAVPHAHPETLCLASTESGNSSPSVPRRDSSDWNWLWSSTLLLKMWAYSLVPCLNLPCVCLYCNFIAFSGVTTGMCRHGVPGWCWLFRENPAGQIDHAHYLPWWVCTLHTHENTLFSRNPWTEAFYSLFLCPIEWPNRRVENT